MTIEEIKQELIQRRSAAQSAHGGACGESAAYNTAIRFLNRLTTREDEMVEWMRDYTPVDRYIGMRSPAQDQESLKREFLAEFAPASKQPDMITAEEWWGYE